MQKAAQTLLEGNLVAFPTETVYGLGADALNKQAVARVYQVKGRPADHPLIVHLGDDANEWTQTHARETGIHQEKFFTDFMKTHSVSQLKHWMQKPRLLYKTAPTLAT